MSFRVPLPPGLKAKKKQCPIPNSNEPIMNLPQFSRTEFTNISLIGQGSYGKVYTGIKHGHTFVIKESLASSENESKLFRKEAQLLYTVKGHENILNIEGYNPISNSMLVDYVAFSFQTIGVENEPVNNLKDLLKTCDAISDFKGFEHIQFYLASDIISGLSFLHSKGIAHRDLKPENVLVSNQHYDHVSLENFWTLRPVLAKLTDFGESRSALVQTRTLTQTYTKNLYRGSPAFMAPEIWVAQQDTFSSQKTVGTSLSELQAMDIWSLGMIMYHLINPNAGHPYLHGIELLTNSIHKSALDKMKYFATAKILPANMPKYLENRKRIWAPIEKVYLGCAQFESHNRPDAEAALTQLMAHHVSIQSLCVSQASFIEEAEVFEAQHTNDTTNACTFLSLLIADRMIASKYKEELTNLTQDVILTFPESINELRSVGRNYSSDEAYPILKTCNAVQMELNFDVIIASCSDISSAEAVQQLTSELTILDGNCEHFCAIYTLPPYTFLISKTSTGLYIVDTHAIPEKFGGKRKAGIIKSIFPEYRITSLVKWLMQRTGKKSDFKHELTILSATNYNTPSANLQSDHHCDQADSSDAVIKEKSGDTESITVSQEAYMQSKDVPVTSFAARVKENSDEIESISVSQEANVQSVHDHLDMFAAMMKEKSGETESFTVSEEESETEDLYEYQQKIQQKNRYSNTELHPCHWDECTAEIINSLPIDINGTRKYQIECNIKDMMNNTKDGRPWGVWKNSSRKNFVGKRRIARCKGSPACYSEICPYKMMYGKENRTQFEKKSGFLQCFSCGTIATYVPCTATKIWEYGQESTFVTVMHKGQHTCIAKPQKHSKKSILKEISEHPNMKPSKLVNEKMVSILSSEDFDWSSVEQVAEDYVDIKQVHNAKQELKRERNPLGENFDALAQFKSKCDEKDPDFIYSMNNRALNGKDSYVFKSSESMMKLAFDMDRDRDGVLCSEFGHVDAKHDRCRGFKTITLWTYHPVMRKLVCLAKMEAERENTSCLVQFWNLLNEALEKVSGVTGYKFNPSGIICDENHANWTSLKTVYGSEFVERVVSCEFHYKQSIQRRVKKLGSKSEEFVLLANALLNAQSETEYASEHKKMVKFVDTDEDLVSWLTWWHARRGHIFKAFKPITAPSSNLAEVGHSKMSSVGSNYMSLLDCARQDIASAVRQEAELSSFASGIAKGGRGVNSKQRMAKEYKAGMKRAKAYAAELDNIGAVKKPALYVASKGNHRPPEKSKQTQGKKKQVKTSEQTNDEISDQRKIFFLRFFHSIMRLKKCYGCGNIFAEKYKKEPHDIVLKHFCHRKFVDHTGRERFSQELKAAYFHTRIDCLRKIVPTVTMSDVIIEPSILKELTAGHKSVLRKFGMDVV